MKCVGLGYGASDIVGVECFHTVVSISRYLNPAVADNQALNTRSIFHLLSVFQPTLTRSPEPDSIMALNQGTTTSMSAVKNNSSHGVADPNAELQQHTLVQSYDPNKGEIQHVDTSYSKPRISCSSRQPAEPKDIEGVQITEVDRSWSARYREYRPHLVRAIILVVTTG